MCSPKRGRWLLFRSGFDHLLHSLDAYMSDACIVDLTADSNDLSGFFFFGGVGLVNAKDELSLPHLAFFSVRLQRFS